MGLDLWWNRHGIWQTVGVCREKDCWLKGHRRFVLYFFKGQCAMALQPNIFRVTYCGCVPHFTLVSSKTTILPNIFPNCPTIHKRVIFGYTQTLKTLTRKLLITSVSVQLLVEAVRGGSHFGWKVNCSSPIGHTGTVCYTTISHPAYWFIFFPAVSKLMTTATATTVAKLSVLLRTSYNLRHDDMEI